MVLLYLDSVKTLEDRLFVATDNLFDLKNHSHPNKLSFDVQSKSFPIYEND